MPFEKGKSGNPNGRRVEKISDQIAKQYGPQAIEIIRDLMENAEESRIRADCAKYLADRAYGKAQQSIEHTGEINSIVVNVGQKLK